jgi:AcrR family transcriptional regulator
VADIAREASIGVGTFYLVFPSKEAVVEELSANVLLQVLTTMRVAAAERANDPLEARLGRVLEARVSKLLELAAGGPHACELVSCTAAPAKEIHARFRDEEALILRSVLEEANARGELAPIDITRTVSLVQRAYASLTPPSLFELSVVEAQRTAHDLAALLVSGIAAHHPITLPAPPAAPGPPTPPSTLPAPRRTSTSKRTR